MATITNKILLKDNQGNILLPITRSILVELSSATKTAFAYNDNGVDSYYNNVDDALAYLHGWQGRQDAKLNNLIDAINDELPGAFTASNITFDNSEYTDPTHPLYKGTVEDPSDTGYVQGAIEALADSLATTIETVEQTVQAAGVSSAIGAGVITVTGSGTAGQNGEQKGDLTIGLNVDGTTLVIDPNTSDLKVNEIDASQVNVTTGQGDNAHTVSLDSKLESIDTILSGVATDTNLENLESRVTAVEGTVSGHTTQIGRIGVQKAQNAGDYAAVYTFTNGAGQTIDINIPKDQFLRSAEYVATAPQNATPEQAALYPALVFTWFVDNDSSSDSPDEAQTVIPVADLIASADTKADQALTILGVTKDPQTGYITVPQNASDAITNKTTVEAQIQGLDTALQGVKQTAEAALTGVDFNGTAATVTDNVAYITADGRNLTLGQLNDYSQTAPTAISQNDTVSTAISKLMYETAQIDNKITLDYVSGGTTDPISNGFQGFVFND